jgi:hypothetical protein
MENEPISADASKADHDGRISSYAINSSRHQVVELNNHIIDNEFSGRPYNEEAGKTIRYVDECRVEIGEIATTCNNIFKIPYLHQ